MATTAAHSPSQLIHEKLNQHGKNFHVSVPCKLLGELINRIAIDPDVLYTPVTREEEGIGIMAGAFLAGKRPVMLMQNSGLGNCVNALCSLVNHYRLPVTLIISHRGTEGEPIEAQRPMGEATVPILQQLDIPHLVVDHRDRIDGLDKLLADGWAASRPVAALFPFSFWKNTAI